MTNLLLRDVEYKIEETRLGTWRRFMYENGQMFSEFTSHKTMLGWPLIHYTYGKSPETGRRIVAKGIIAIGRIAFGGVAIGHAAFGVIAVGQLALSLLFGLGQLSIGTAAVGQFALGTTFALGQIVAGSVAIGQIAFGKYVLAQVGFGEFVWSTQRYDPEAVEFFKFFKWLRPDTNPHPIIEDL